MLKTVTTAVVLIVSLSRASTPQFSTCGSSPEKGWLKFVDQANGFCFWYAPTYKRETGTHELGFPKEGQVVAILISSQPRKAFFDDKEPAAVQICLLPGAFDLKKLIREAPTGYDTPPAPKRYGAHVFYYYGPGGGGVAYPDMYYFNLDGRALRIVFDGPYPGDSKSPTRETHMVEQLILSSFRPASH